MSRSFDEKAVADFFKDLENQRPMSMLEMEVQQSEFPDSIGNGQEEKRTSLIIIKEGYLFKKTDFRPFHKHTKLERGWKLYKVVLRGHKLYLFKVLSESSFRSLFPSAQNISTGPTSLKLVSSDFDCESQQTLFHSPKNPTEGLSFTELHQINMQPKSQVYLALDNNYIYICIKSDKKKWKIKQKLFIKQLTLALISCSNLLSFSLSTTDRSTLGIYSTQHVHIGQAWIQIFQRHSQKSTLLLHRDFTNSDHHTTCNFDKRYHPELQKRPHTTDGYVIVGGTIAALVQELLLTEDQEYVHAFLLSYPTFTTGSNVLKEIKSLLSISDSALNTRVLNIFKIWSQNFALDIVGDVASGIISVLDAIENVETIKVKEIVLTTVSENAHDDPEYSDTGTDGQEEETETSEIENILSIDGDSVNLSNLLITGLEPLIFLKISPDSFADHVYIFHQSQYTKHQQELMNPVSYLPRPQTSVEMLNSLLFTTASPHFLTKLIRNQILIDSQQYGAVETSIRARLLKHWIMIGSRLYRLGDATGWCAIAMGLCSVGIVRLKEAWKSVERTMVQTVQQHWAHILAEHGMFGQNIWVKTWENGGLVKFAKVLDLNRPKSLPFFGTIRQAIDRYRRHSRSLENDLINFEECQHTYRTIKKSLDGWERPSRSEKRETQGPLQSFFEYSVTDLVSVPHDLKYLQESSLACEPKLSFQAHGPTPKTPVTFPAVLNCCTLLESEWTFIYSPKKMAAEIFCCHLPSDQSKKSSASADVYRPRRRTLSFPFGHNHAEAYSAKSEILESTNSKTWLGSLTLGRHHSTYPTKVLIEAHRKNQGTGSSSGGFDLSVAGLVFKVAAIQRNDKFIPLERTDSINSAQFLNQENEQSVTIKGGYFENLVDCLVHGIYFYQDLLKEQWQILCLTEGLDYQTEKIVMDQGNFIDVFFTFYRSFSQPKRLLEMLQMYFVDAKLKCKIDLNSSLPTLLETYFSDTRAKPLDKNEIKSEEINMYNWKQVASIQLCVLNLIMYWVEEHPLDFIDEPEFTRYTNNFLKDSIECLDMWRRQLKNCVSKDPSRDDLIQALAIGDEIQQKIDRLENIFIQTSLSPCYDMKSIEFDAECMCSSQILFQQLKRGVNMYTSTLHLSVCNSTPFSVSYKPVDIDSGNLVDRYSPEVLLEQIDEKVCRLLECVNSQDWVQAFDALETQCNKPHSWLPSRNAANSSINILSLFTTVVDVPSPYPGDHRVLPEEVFVSDIFTAIQGVEVPQSALPNNDILHEFSESVKNLYCMHFIIRNWAIHEISSPTIDFKKRLMRIDKFLQMVLLSKTCSKKMSIFPELKASKDKRVPGFVENAIASALVSPEVRLFTRAWSEISTKYGNASLDSLECLLEEMGKTRSSSTILSLYDESYATVSPSIGWIFERVIEICLVPDTVEKNGLINFEKKRYLYHFLQMVINAQAVISASSNNVKNKDLAMSFLISPNPSKINWKTLKEHVALENSKACGKNIRGPSGPRAVVFSQIVTQQIENLKKYFKERDRIDKDLLQYKAQKKRTEQTRPDRQERPHSIMPRINSFIKGLRPPSLVYPIQNFFPTNNNNDQLAATKASTVINLINSTTSVASTYTKRDYVFRIVTEEGGQYLFQSTSGKDMYDWMSQINDTAREGAIKRQSVLAAESLNSTSERRKSALLIESSSRNKQQSHRKSVYGAHIDNLMFDGKIPIIVEKCIKEIEKRGLEEVGIYRVAGTGSVVSKLKAEFNKDVQKVNLENSKWADINVVADSFKQFLRELSEPLLTYSYYDEFINASASEDHDQRVYLIKKVVKKLPNNNYILLKRIIEHFVIVTDFEGINHMYATNLAIVFGPTLLQPAPGPASFATTMSNLGHQQNIVKYLILNYHYLFDLESEELDIRNEQVLAD